MLFSSFYFDNNKPKNMNIWNLSEKLFRDMS